MGSYVTENTDFEDVKVLSPKVFEDNRGFFLESYNKRDFEKIGLEIDFIQDNHSFSKDKGTIRGLHYQSSPAAQTKLVQVISGKILDVVVDIREFSPTFGKWISVELSGENKKQILIPKGFAHGFCTLTENCHVVYKVDSYYSTENNRGIAWDDETLKIKWPSSNPILSDQDKNWPRLNEIVHEL